jgi:hypothetical protein
MLEKASPYDLHLSIGQTRYFMLDQVSIALEGVILINADCKGVERDQPLQQGGETNAVGFTANFHHHLQFKLL